MSAASKKFGRKICGDSRNAISSPASGHGARPLERLDGQMILPCGPEAVRARVSVSAGSGEASVIRVTYGLHGSDSLTPVVQPSFLESRSLVQASSEKQCKRCGLTKSADAFRKHDKGGLRGSCRECENELTRMAKPWKSENKKKYMAKRRETHRGFALTADAKRRAAEHNLPFDLDWREIQRRIEVGACEVTGLPFDLTQPKSWNAPSLDQIVPSAGYTQQNTRVVLYALNTMANNWGVELIVKIADAIKTRRSLNASNTLSRKLAENLKKKTQRLGSTLFDLTWSEHITPSGHVLPRLAASAVRTSGSGCTSWPTVRAHERGQYQRDRGTKEMERPTLTGVAALAGWNTPQATDVKGGEEGRVRAKGKGHHGQRNNDLAKLAGWATPQKHDAQGAKTMEQIQKMRRMTCAGVANLNEQVLQTVSGGMPNTFRVATQKLSAQLIGGQLNPGHSRWLMGFRAEWERCHPGYASWRKWQAFLSSLSAKQRASVYEALKATATR